jgi:hypothetical protein
MDGETTIEEAKAMILKATQVDEKELNTSETGNFQVMLYCGQALYFENWATQVFVYMDNTKNHTPFVSNLMLNQKRPKSEYHITHSAFSNPQLKLGKKKEQRRSSGEADGQGL